MRHSVEAVAIMLVMSMQIVSPAGSGDVLFQVSTISALMDGVFDGSMSFGDLKRHGDFGLGTFDALDGEMVGLDGHFYQVRADGSVQEVNDSTLTPFSDVTFFDSDDEVALGSSNMTQVERCLEELLPTRNIFYAIRIDGTFSHVRARSVPPQSRPYPNLTIAVMNQSIFDLYNQSGTVVGFWTPSYASGLNVPGYHLHFINDERTAGGHLLDFQLMSGNASIDHTDGFMVVLPDNKDFYAAGTGGVDARELEAVESMKPG
ncbi:MAG TPA: acetolactate decarboxylase [Methanothrix sp.]|nr:acetolactate decarboxylase [Methanothrix sp.]HOK58715.1 acetolactate decarboxylase [Methanothrix sp.]HOL43887.1 acetolactate decarboxylase [Methanothrix sp.]HPO88945.1 acetolactate decarboxylase [Methanothrix sp.]